MTAVTVILIISSATSSEVSDSATFAQCACPVYSPTARQIQSVTSSTGLQAAWGGVCPCVCIVACSFLDWAALSQTYHNHKCLCPSSVLFLPLSTRALSSQLIAAALLWRRGFAGAASASGSVFGSACKQPTTNALRTMRAPSYCSMQVHGYCSRLVGVHCNPSAKHNDRNYTI